MLDEKGFDLWADQYDEAVGLSDEHLSQIEHRTNIKPGKLKASDTSALNWDRMIESRKSSTRCKVEHPFLIVKRQFGYAKVAYCGIAKNFIRFNVLFACANIVMCARAGRNLTPLRV